MGILSLRKRQTDNREEYERLKFSDSSLIYAPSESVEDFSIELTVGDQWAEDISGDSAVMYEIDGEEITIPARSSIVLEVEEELIVPFNMYGQILQTGSVFLEKGLIVAAGKIEPSFQGKLKILIFNTSKTKRKLKKGQKLASAIFMRTDRTISAAIYSNKRSPSTKTLKLTQRISKFWLSDLRFTAMFAATILSSSLAAYLLGEYNSSQQKHQSVEQHEQIATPEQKEGKLK